MINNTYDEVTADIYNLQTTESVDALLDSYDIPHFQFWPFPQNPYNRERNREWLIFSAMDRGADTVWRILPVEMATYFHEVNNEKETVRLCWLPNGIRVRPALIGCVIRYNGFRFTTPPEVLSRAYKIGRHFKLRASSRRLSTRRSLLQQAIQRRPLSSVRRIK